MHFFLAVIAFLLVFLAVVVLVLLHYVRKGIIKFKKAVTGDYDDEETFKRMADKHYRGKNDPNFDKDYFRSAGSSRSGGSSQGSGSSQSGGFGRGGENQEQAKRTTTTSDGVTIIDERPDDERRKIFNDGEGEYVDYQEVK